MQVRQLRLEGLDRDIHCAGDVTMGEFPPGSDIQ
jgi:hypothetical protein